MVNDVYAMLGLTQVLVYYPFRHKVDTFSNAQKIYLVIIVHEVELQSYLNLTQTKIIVIIAIIRINLKACDHNGH